MFHVEATQGDKKATGTCRKTVHGALRQVVNEMGAFGFSMTTPVRLELFERFSTVLTAHGETFAEASTNVKDMIKKAKSRGGP